MSAIIPPEVQGKLQVLADRIDDARLADGNAKDAAESLATAQDESAKADAEKAAAHQAVTDAGEELIAAIKAEIDRN